MAHLAVGLFVGADMLGAEQELVTGHGRLPSVVVGDVGEAEAEPASDGGVLGRSSNDHELAGFGDVVAS